MEVRVYDNEICICTEDPEKWSALNQFFNQNHPDQTRISKSFKITALVVKSDQGPWANQLRIMLDQSN